MSESANSPEFDILHSSEFIRPIKKIHDGADVDFFLTSMAYKDIIQFMLQLNRAMIPRKAPGDESGLPCTWSLPGDPSIFSKPVLHIRKLLESLEALIADAPPDPGPRRFGNVSFRTWYGLVQKSLPDLFAQLLPTHVLKASQEIEAYLMGSFGSAQRLDYGTGHELSFLAFLGCLWKLGYFAQVEPGVEERSIVIGIVEPYLKLIRRLITTYNLEPAGSHGVWGLDDNSFLPYIFGSAQLAPAITENDDTPTQGSVINAPDPASVVKANLVERERNTNMYFSAVAFIYEVKKGPFWEHSPMLFDISGIKDGWGKINKGMIKMYNAEVLSKFPVVQHFPFGSLFRWEKDPDAKPVQATTHTASQPLRTPVDASAPTTTRPMGPPSTAAPWASTGRPAAAPKGFVNGVTQAPWASRTSAPPPPRGGFNAQSRSSIARPVPKSRETPEPQEADK